jgi:hypothetical protein
MAKKAHTLAIGDLVARVEAPTVFYRVTERFPGYVRVLPYQRSGREQILISVRHGRRTVWAGDGSEWTVISSDLP